MSPWFERGQVHIPWGDTFSQHRMRPFVDEIMQYPSGRTTDTVMAFWFAWRELQIAGARYPSFNRLQTTRTAWGKSAPRFGARTIKNPFYERREA
jgi:hypothetical protein